MIIPAWTSTSAIIKGNEGFSLIILTFVTALGGSKMYVFGTPAVKMGFPYAISVKLVP